MPLVEEPTMIRADYVPAGVYVRFRREGRVSWERLIASPRYGGRVCLWTKDTSGDIHRTEMPDSTYVRVAREEMD